MTIKDQQDRKDEKLKMARYREEVINIRISDILREMGFQASGEIISKGKLPDIMVYISGIKINIEGRFEGSPELNNLRGRCKSRVDNGICDIAMGLIYPKNIREAQDDYDHIKKIKNAQLESFAMYIDSQGVKELDFTTGSVANIAEKLSNIYTTIISNDVLHSEIKNLNERIKDTHELALKSELFFSSKVVIEKLKDVLGLREK